MDISREQKIRVIKNTYWRDYHHYKDEDWDKMPDDEVDSIYNGIQAQSNYIACIHVGNNHIFSCNKSKLYKYKSKRDHDRTSGYPFSSKLLVVIIPNH